MRGRRFDLNKAREFTKDMGKTRELKRVHLFLHLLRVHLFLHLLSKNWLSKQCLSCDSTCVRVKEWGSVDSEVDRESFNSVLQFRLCSSHQSSRTFDSCLSPLFSTTLSLSPSPSTDPHSPALTHVLPALLIPLCSNSFIPCLLNLYHCYLSIFSAFYASPTTAALSAMKFGEIMTTLRFDFVFYFEFGLSFTFASDLSISISGNLLRSTHQLERERPLSFIVWKPPEFKFQDEGHNAGNRSRKSPIKSWKDSSESWDYPTIWIVR